MTTERLRFSPSILQRLGEELLPQRDHAIVELIRNSYDADAVHCRVELFGVDQPGGSIRVSDDGVGMDLEAIRSGWLVVGSSNKPSGTLTALGRRPVGEKGLGRLSALRMGGKVTLKTRHGSKPRTELQLTINWEEYDQSAAVEDILLEILEIRTEEPQGTSVEIRDIALPFDRVEVENLSRALLLLADPFDDSQGFHPELVASEFSDLERKVRNSYFDDAVLHLVSELDSMGTARIQVDEPRSGQMRWTGVQPNSAKKKYHTAPAKFELWTFLLDRRSLAHRSSTLEEVTEWLGVVGGVHLYHRGLRVHPYGDPGHDWLDMNLLRVRNPELRPSTNTSIGRVIVPDPEQVLTEKTDRTGFIEDGAFQELKHFARDSLEWMARQRVAERDNRRRQTRTRAPTRVAKADEDLREEISRLPAQERESVSKAVDRLRTARRQEGRALREDLQLYRTLASLGTTVALFAHESGKPVSQIKQMAGSIERRAKEALGPTYKAVLEGPVRIIQNSARALESYASFPISVLRREKRYLGVVDVHDVITDMVDLFGPFLEDSKISCNIDLCGGDPKIWGSVAALESVLSNLITNAITAFNEHPVHEQRKLVVRTQLMTGNVLIAVSDSGPGIVGIPVEEIWLPGRTSTPGGTGLGLTIVRDTVDELGGRVEVLKNGDLGGAELIVFLPLFGGDDG